MSVITILFLAFAVLFFLMMISWILQVYFKNAGIVDVTWSYNFPVLALIYFFTTDGFFIRKLIILTMVCIWGVRLGTHLLIRTAGHINEEDGRYKELRKEWSKNLQLKFFLFFQFQGILNLILSIPFLLISLNPITEINKYEMAGVFLWTIAIIGEATADYQLKKFKSDPANKGMVCEYGLWNYSRHPNYFFEWLIWIAYFITALGSAYGWLSIICPLIMSYFLFKVTGIPMTEEQSIRTKGEAYKRYQQTTSVFFLWFKKSG